MGSRATGSPGVDSFPRCLNNLPQQAIIRTPSTRCLYTARQASDKNKSLTHTHISPLANRESEREGETDREKDRRTDRQREKELMDRDMAMREKGTRGHTRQAVLRAEEMEIGDDDCYS